MKTYLFTAIIFLGALLLVNPEASAEARKPNIVFFLVDDLGWSDIACYGSSFYDTPRVDQLAKDGVRFTDAYAACHVCSPTRASILTGKSPASLNLTDWLPGRRNFPFQMLKNAEINQHLPYEEVTIAEKLKELGYSTGIFGKWHLGKKPSDPKAHGFDIHTPDVPSNWRTFHGPFKMKTFPSQKGDYLTDRITDEALDWVTGNKDKPFFLYMSHFAVHDPIQGRKDLVDKYTEKLTNQKATDSPDFVLETNPDNPNRPSQKELAQLLKTQEFARHKVLPKGTIKIRQKQDNIEFAAMVESVDQSLGRIIDKLDELGIEDDTIVIFFSDNGGMAAMNVGNPKRIVPEDSIDRAYATSSLPLRGAKGWLYEGGIRVPCVIKWPKRGKSGTVCSTPVHSIDFFPTILEMIGQADDISDDLEGVSLVPLVQGENIKPRNLYWHFPHYSNHGMHSPGGAIRSGKYKLLEYFEHKSVQLFDLEQDIGEQNNLASQQPEKAKELQEQLHAWRAQVGAQMMETNEEYDWQMKAEDYYQTP